MVRLLVCWIGFLCASTVLPLNLHAGDSSSLMDVSPDATRLLVAHTDAGTVSLVDLQARKQLWEVPVGDHPEGVAILPESFLPGQSLGAVTVYGDDCVKLLDLSDGTILGTIPVGDEPYGIVTTRDGLYAYVTNDYPGTITEIDLKQRAVSRTFRVGQDCRGLAIDAANEKLYVTEFFTGTLLEVDRSSGKVSDAWPGHPQDNLARHVVLHPKRGKAYLSHIRSRVTTFDARGSIFPQLSFCDLDSEKKNAKDRRRSIALDTYNGVYVVTNPWEAALSPDGSKIYTIYAGTDDMNVSRTIDDDYEEIDRIGRAVTVGKHPRAVRTSPDGKEVYIYNTLDHEIVIYNDTLRQKLGRIAVGTPARTPAWRRGKELFQSALQPMGSARWIACSSCHPDGLTDGRVWHNPEGLRKTMSLFGLAHTHPLHWSGDRDEVQDFEYTIRGKLMRGRGLAKAPLKPRDTFTEFAELDQKTSGLSNDLDALAIYTNSFPVRLSPHAPGGKLTPQAQRGKALFESKAVGCTQCHNGPYLTDSSLAKPFRLHDVGTGTGDPSEKIGPKFDTPTLLGIYRQKNYLHDGRAQTIEEVLTKFNYNDQHGKTSHLKKDEIDDLVAFLKSLPYETPPEETPNTVPDRVK